MFLVEFVFLILFWLRTAVEQEPKPGTAEITDAERGALLGGRQAGRERAEDTAHVCRAHVHATDNVPQLQEAAQGPAEAGHAVSGLQAQRSQKVLGEDTE
jgi:hypothetical protein